jgi:hypothetical protein
MQVYIEFFQLVMPCGTIGNARIANKLKNATEENQAWSK